jgi:pimeloyl-ACP methyl ester carboxylesterase
MPTFTTADGVDLRYEVRGTGPPVYVCQGGPSNVCDTLVAELEPLADSCTLVFHDYRGSGHSAAADPGTYRFDRFADDLDELRRHLGHDRIALLVHSMGGFVGLEYALRHEATCDRLALVGTTPCGKTGPMIVPVLRELGLLRMLRVAALGVRYLVVWSWRRPSDARTDAMYAPMSITQEGSPATRAAWPPPTRCSLSTTTTRRTSCASWARSTCAPGSRTSAARSWCCTARATP